MDTPVRERTAELEALVVKFIALRSAAHLRARLLRGLAVELIAVYRSWLTLKEIWKGLCEHGYQGSYPQFCKRCGRIVGLRSSESRSAQKHIEENLLPQEGERGAAQGESSSSVNDGSEIQERGKAKCLGPRERLSVTTAQENKWEESVCLPVFRLAVRKAWQTAEPPPVRRARIGQVPARKILGDERGHSIFVGPVRPSRIVVGEVATVRQSVGQQAGAAVGQQVGQLGVEVTRRNLNIQPTIKVRPGYRFFVRVEKDILFKGPYTPMRAGE